MHRSIILAFFLLVGFQSNGQQVEELTKNEKRAIVYLKGGTQLEVSILEWDLEKGIKATTLWGQEIFFPNDRIRKVKSYSDDVKWNPYKFRKKGVYYALSAGLITSNHGQRLNGTNGYTFSFSSGYRFHRLFSIGLGTGIDQYAYKSGERIHPIFVDLRSFLFARNTTLFVNIQAGYSLAFNNENKSIVDSQGGFMFYPNIGLSFGGSETKYSFDVGYKFQKSNWTYASQWDVRNQTEYRMNYQRFVMRFGFVL